MKKILFISNGHGEDLAAAEIIKKLIAGSAFDISALPVVGQGKAFDGLGIRILGPRKELPGGGFSLRNIKYLAGDLFYGLLGNIREQYSALKQLKGQFDQVVAVGDIVAMLGAKMVRDPFIFVGVNKSSYYRWFGYNYTPWEKFMLKNFALKVFVRDRYTEESLRNYGIKVPQAEYVGNPLMDCLEPVLRLKSRAPAPLSIGLLPGTREDARLNLHDLERVIKEIIKMNKEDIEFKFVTATKEKNIPADMENRPFSEVLSRSKLIIGLSGTGNEQAAGSGIPVISFYGRGSQYNRKFAEAQKQLLGDALSLVRGRDPIAAAAEVWRLLRDPSAMEQMGKIGRERMGEPGAVEKIAEFIEKSAAGKIAN